MAIIMAINRDCDMVAVSAEGKGVMKVGAGRVGA